MKKKQFLAVACLMALAGGAFAQDTIQGVPVFVVGSDPPVPGGFNTGAKTAAERFFDDGVTNGDQVAGDNVFTVTLNITNPNPLPTPPLFQVKAASDGFSPVNAPDSGFDNGRAPFPAASGPVRIFLRTVPFADGFLPDVGPGPWADGYLWAETTRPYLDAIYAANNNAFKVVGSHQGFDSAASTTILSSQGNGIYEGTLTGVAAGSYDFKVTVNDGFNPSFGGLGLNPDGANLQFATASATDVVTFTLDANTGRVRALNPAVSPGPPFYATSSAWGTGLDSTTELTDNGDGTFRRSFTVANPGLYTVRVRQNIGRPFPDTGDYPFSVPNANSTIDVIFDRNTLTDGFLPASDFVTVLVNGAPANRFRNVNLVGFETAFGGLGDFDTIDALTAALDNGISPDLVEFDEIHTLIPTFNNNPVASFVTEIRPIKAVGQRAIDTNPDSGFNIQFGGPIDGVTLFGNNISGDINLVTGQIYTFKVDTITGRVGGGVSLGLPTRPAYVPVGPFGPIVDISSVNEWMMY